MAMNISITHVAINVNDMEETLRFYQDTLGFSKIFEVAHPQTGAPWIIYIQVCAGQFLELFYDGKPRSATDADAGFTHLCFAVDDVETLANKIVENGFSLEIEPCVGPDKNKQAWIRDPNGVRIELMQISPESPHAAFM